MYPHMRHRPSGGIAVVYVRARDSSFPAPQTGLRSQYVLPHNTCMLVNHMRFFLPHDLPPAQQAFGCVSTGAQCLSNSVMA